VKCNVLTRLSIKQDMFLSSSTNKSRFIEMLSVFLIDTGNKVVNCDEDADTEIVRCALDVALTGRRVNVVVDDTDDGLLLLYHWKVGMADITFTSDRSKATFDISSSLSVIPAGIRSYILALHAWTGCDTTSAIHSKGKNSLMKKVETSQYLRSLLGVLCDRDADQVEVGESGIKWFSYMYNGQNQELSKLRYGNLINVF
jgi:hypothetical protein